MRRRYRGAMATDLHVPAELIWSIQQPWKASLGDCLSRWRALDPRWRTQSYLVVHGEGDARRTLGAEAIAVLASEGAGVAPYRRAA
jgi:hypothetical protein